MIRPEDLPPHLRPYRELPRFQEELPLLEELPPPEMGPRGERFEPPPPTPADPFLRH